MTRGSKPAQGAGDPDSGPGRSLLQEGRFAEAVAFLSPLVQARPDDVPLRLLRARALLGCGDEAKAAVDVDRAARRRPEAPWTLAGERIESDFARGRHGDALEGLQARLAQDPRCGWAYALRAEVQRVPAFLRYDRALEDLSRATALAPRTFWIWAYQAGALEAAGRLPDALEAWDRALELEPECPWALLGRSRARLAARRVPAALSDAERLCRVDPKNPEGPLARARCHLELGRPEEASQAALAALALAAGRWEPAARAHEIRFEAFRQRGLLAKAAVELRHAAVLGGRTTWTTPGRPSAGDDARSLQELHRLAGSKRRDNWVHAWLGEACLRLGDWARAQRELGRALRSDRGLFWARLWSGECRLRMGCLRQALEDFQALRRAVSRARGGSAGLRLEGGALTRLLTLEAQARLGLGRLRSALVGFNAAIARDGAGAQAYRGRGEVLWRLGRSDAALEDLRRALELDPRYAEAFAVRAEILDARGEPEAALADLDRAVALNPQDARVYLLRSCVQGRLGRHAEQLRDFQTALRIQPEFFRGRLAALRGRARKALETGRLQGLVEVGLKGPNGHLN